MKHIVFANDYLSTLARKGELIEGLYNPGNLFDEVHIVLTNTDGVDSSEIQKTVGTARLFIHNLPPPSFRLSLGWQPIFLINWVRRAIALTKSIQPDLIRCQGFNIHTFLAGKVSKATKTPSIVSLHGNPDVDYLRLSRNIQERFYITRWKNLAESQIKNFSHVIAVYSPIQPYLEQKGVTAYSIIHNLVGLGALVKTDYSLQGPLKLICIGRQTIHQKDQRDIVRAVAALENVHLYLIGNGDLHADLRDIVNNMKLQERVFLIPDQPNEIIMNTLKNYDVYIYNSINFEISKTVMEAALVGLPIIHNTRVPSLSSELEQIKVLKVDNSVTGYQDGIKILQDNQILRQEMGLLSREIATNLWNPEITEARIVSLYKSLIPLQ
jgi:glycosyltransferase involved in cell wall biosynthesis